MRLLTFQTGQVVPGIARFYDAVRKFALVDVVTAEVNLKHIKKFVGERPGTVLFVHDAWMLPVVKYAIDNGLPVAVLCTKLEDWHCISTSGLSRYVDFFLFGKMELANQVNRNLNHVVVELLEDPAAGVADVNVFVAMLENIVQHHKHRRPKVAQIRKERAKTAREVRRLCALGYNEEPSFTELQFFVDAIHTRLARRALITNLPTLLQNQASARDIRNLLAHARARG